MKRFPVLLLSGLALLLAGAVAAWLLRFRVADDLVARRLKAAGVPASYRITRLDPFRQRIEDVRIGDPAAPDLIAGRIDLELEYGLGGPVIRQVRAAGVRLRGRVEDGRMRFGALDRLLPQSEGPTTLPNLDLGLTDARVSLATPAGALAVRIDGGGNPQRLFRGRAALTTPALRFASCRLGDVRADLALTVRRGAPEAEGSAGVGRTNCPDIALGRGALRLAVRADAAFRRFAGRAAPSGFGGTVQEVRFAGVGGAIDGRGAADAVDLTARLVLDDLAVPAAARFVRAIPDAAGTPVGPVLARARAGVGALIRRSDARIDGSIAMRDRTLSVDLARLTLSGDDGAHLVLNRRGELSWTKDGLRLDGDLSTGGGALPTLSLQLRQSAAGAPIRGSARLDPYRAGAAMIAVPAARFDWADGRLTVAPRLRMDGPFAGGAVRGLDLPVRGWIDADGALAIGQGCQTVTADQARIASVTFVNVRLPVCGAPLVARAPGGAVRIAGRTGPLRFSGRSGDGAPVIVAAAATRLSGQGFAVDRLDGAIGATRLTVAHLDGTLAGQGIFAGAAARIGAVPLVLDEAQGRWRLDGSALRLAGMLRVADTAAPPRFNPLIASDATLDLIGGRITADAVLREPVSRAAVMTVAVTHDLASGSGGARLAMDGLRFVPKGLQPEAITPLTLGVVANVAGTVQGIGRIDWDARGVTSSGAFGTDGLDLAAAFGPVTGLKGRIVFTDLLGLVSAPDQMATVAEINPGIVIADGAVRFHLPGENRLAVDEARWPFAGGTLRLAPTVIDLAADRDRRLTFRLDALDAGAFVQQLDLPNVSATGTFDGVLPMIFGQTGGRIEEGRIAARPPGGTLAYVGELSAADLGAMGKLAFDALKAIRYSSLTIDLDGQLDGEMVSRVRFTGVREATAEQSLVTRLIRGLPFRFNIAVRAPFRGLLGTARTYADPSLLLRQATPAVQPPASGGVR